MESVSRAAKTATPDATLSPDESFTDDTSGRLVGRATQTSARPTTTKSDLTSSPDSEPERAVIESYATLTRIPEGSDYSWTRHPRSARGSDKIIEERNPATNDSSPTNHSATQRDHTVSQSIHTSDSESHRTTASSGTSVILDSAANSQTSLLQVVHDDLELNALAATTDSHAFAAKKGAHSYHGKHHHRQRRLSDDVASVGESYGRGGTQYAVAGARDLDGGASQLSCTTLSAIMEAIKDSTESINRTISEKMRDSETMSRPRSAVSSSNSLPTASRFHSLGAHSPSPSVHASVSGGGAFHQSYSPGVISDMVREIRENSRVREEALMANMRSIMEDRSWMQNETLTRLTRDVEDLKRSFQSVRTDVDGMKTTLEGMRSEVANLGLQMNYLMAQHQLLAHPPANYTTTNFTHGQPTPSHQQPFVAGGMTLRRTVDHCLQQPHHHYYPATAAAARLSIPPDDVAGEYGAKPGGPTVYEMLPNATSHKAPSSPRTGLLVRDDIGSIHLENSTSAAANSNTTGNDCTLALHQQLQATLRVQGLYEDQIAALTRRTLSLQGEIEHSKGSARNGTSPPDSLPTASRPGPAGTTVQTSTHGAHGMVSPRDNLPYLQMLTGPVTDL